MRFTFSSDQLLLRDTVRELLEKECTPADARAGFSRERWMRLAELGVIGMLANDERGGLSLGDTDLVLVLEEAGRVALPDPLIENAAVAVAFLADHVAELVSGTTIAAVGLGRNPLIAQAEIADIFLLGSDGDIHVVPRERVILDPQRSIDSTRSLSRAEWTPETSTLVRKGGATEVFDRAAFGSSAYLLGLAARMIDMAAAYAGERHQFGRPIGSFQAIKHKLADAYLALEFARPVVYRAADSIERNSPTVSRDVSMAKAFASDAATGAAKAALQTLGAIGYTQEHDLHIWMKRAWSLASAWGNADFHRARVADALRLEN